MRIRTANCRMGLIVVMVLGILVVTGSSSRALDFDDLVTLIENGVQESTIVSILEDGGGVDLDQEDEDILRRMGVGEHVIILARTAPRDSSGTNPSQTPQGSVAALPTAAPVAGPAAGSPVQPVPVARSNSFPSLYSKEGWLSISNQDSTPYYLSVNTGNKRLFVSRSPNGGYEILPGENLVLNIRKETYKLYGDSGRELKVRVRENEVTNLNFVPFGVVGNSGLQGVVQDRERVRNEILFNNYTPAPPVVLVEEPPVIVVPSHPVYRPRHYYFYDEPRRYRRHRGGTSFGFGFGW